jgi:hypothetical protein
MDVTCVVESEGTSGIGQMNVIDQMRDREGKMGLPTYMLRVGKGAESWWRNPASLWLYDKGESFINQSEAKYSCLSGPARLQRFKQLGVGPRCHDNLMLFRRRGAETRLFAAQIIL